MTLDPEIAEDLSQDTMLRLFKNLPHLSFETAGRFWAWVYKTALNRIRDHYDEQHRREHGASETGFGRLRASARQDTSAGDLEHAIHQELVAAVTKAMKELRLRHRSILTLRCFQQLSYAQIAQVMGGSQLQAKLLFFRAKQSLRRQLARDGIDAAALVPALRAFAAMTLPSGEKAAAATLVSPASVKVGAGTAVLAFDLAQLRVPFEIRAIRIRGGHYFTPTEHYRLGGVRARTVPAGAQ